MDKVGDALPPADLGKLLAQAHAEEKVAWEEHLVNPKPERKASLKRSFRLLRAARKLPSSDLQKGASPKKLQTLAAALPHPLPDAWRKALRVTDGGTLSGEGDGEGDTYEVIRSKRLPSFHEEEDANLRREGAELPLQLLHVAKTSCGDLCSLDLSTVSAKGDCRVLLISHETLSAEREWESVAQFLEEVLTVEQA